MSNPATTLLVAYVIFVWLVILHTLEEIACDVIGIQVGPIKLTRNRYLLAASALSTVNLGTLVLLILGLPAGYYLGLFTSALIGCLQGIVHTIGFFRTHRKMRGLGVGFYSSIPLSISGAGVFILLMKAVFS
jgi:hypothetical protein